MLTVHPIPASNYLRENYTEVLISHHALNPPRARFSSSCSLAACIAYHPSLCSQFFAAYNQLLQSDNFIVKVHAFNLLSTLLFERSNHDVMMKSAAATRTTSWR